MRGGHFSAHTTQLSSYRRVNVGQHIDHLANIGTHKSQSLATKPTHWLPCGQHEYLRSVNVGHPTNQLDYLANTLATAWPTSMTTHQQASPHKSQQVSPTTREGWCGIHTYTTPHHPLRSNKGRSPMRIRARTTQPPNYQHNCADAPNYTTTQQVQSTHPYTQEPTDTEPHHSQSRFCADGVSTL